MPITGELYTFNETNIARVPDEAGVYALYDGTELIYIGRARGTSETIRTRLRSHYNGDEGPCTQAATAYRREVTSSPVERERAVPGELLITLPAVAGIACPYRKLHPHRDR